ncbi:uncharacterized protein LOC118426702 isoform X1 [Branchiostoma floridae]|uniref:Uncharacterized protein LOC118426702 isoform X1 n=1 Tax=Branchiostoma floridae TaxID=7739 RepID=A0A9J7M2W4_BRAFL|nr:uncharacterized protein LOC118426702 isoform X1 [Branchiostoma floridae]
MLGSRGKNMSEVYGETKQASESFLQMSEMPQVSFLTLDGKYHVCGQDAVYYTDDNGTERFVEGGTVDLCLTEDEWGRVMPIDDGYGPDFILKKYLECEVYEEIAQDAQECEEKVCVQDHDDMEAGKWNFPWFSAWSVEEFLDEMENLQKPKEVNNINSIKATSHTPQNDGEVSKQFKKYQPHNQPHVESQRMWEDGMTIYMSESDLDQQLLGHAEGTLSQNLWEDGMSIYMSESDLDKQLQLLGHDEGSLSQNLCEDGMTNYTSESDGWTIYTSESDGWTIYASESDLDKQLQFVGHAEGSLSQNLWEDGMTIYMSGSDQDQQLQLLGQTEVPMLYESENIYHPVTKKATRLSRYDLHHGPDHNARSPSRPLIGSRGDSKGRIVLDWCLLETSLLVYTTAGAGHQRKEVHKTTRKRRLQQTSMYIKQPFSGVVFEKVCFPYICCSCWLLLMGLPSLFTLVFGLQKFGKCVGKGQQGQQHR